MKKKLVLLATIVLMMTGAIQTHANLVTNGGFENRTGGLNSQNFSAVAGDTYSLSFYYGSYWPSPQKNLSVTIGDLSHDFAFTENGEWIFFTTTLFALTSNSLLQFSCYTNLTTSTVSLDDLVVEATVPPFVEPASMLLFGTGIACLAGFRLRRKNSSP